MRDILKNGLSKEQVTKAREILKSVSVRKVASRLNVSDTSIYNVLRGSNPDIQLLHNALNVANEMIAENKELIASLPI